MHVHQLVCTFATRVRSECLPVTGPEIDLLSKRVCDVIWGEGSIICH